GFYVYGIKASAAKKGFAVKISNIAFDGLIPSLKTGTIDIIINDVTITEERAKEVWFSKPYYTAGLGLVVLKGSPIRKQADLKGCRVGVSIGSTGALAAHKIQGIRVREFNSIVDAFLDLKNKGVDAVINDKPTNEYFIEKKGRAYAEAYDGDFEVEYLGIAARLGDKELQAKIDGGLAEIKASGEYAAIYKKWFGRAPSAEELK
ncbi:MAG: basic amino acid ABC transporter substrate-binding protein, partial [Duodenibacillus sp.]|nr:basic amino acid ABC transporter substrate-binding protein [Duodenibacillus sp.]